METSNESYHNNKHALISDLAYEDQETHQEAGQTVDHKYIKAIDPEAIERIFYPYVAINSESGTPAENAASAYVYRHFKDHPYFVEHPDHFGLYKVEHDPHQREVAWAMIKGSSNRTIVMVHHFDVVEIEDFKNHKAFAFNPENLLASLAEDPEAISEEAMEDLKSNQWIFGRGSADMKGGGSIQIAIMDAFGHQEDFDGTLILIAVSDEENLSGGMRSAAMLLDEIKDRYQLDYILMINSEPHQRKTPECGMLSGGSIGKILPFVYVRGILAHAGKSPEGFNPVQILSEIVRRTEMNPSLADVAEEVGEMSPPPTWLMVRDSKTTYDVSMPLTAFGCISFQPLSSMPDQIIRTLVDMARFSAEEVAARVNVAADLYHKHTKRPKRTVRWAPEVLTFSELIQRCEARFGERFHAFYQDALKKENDNMYRGIDNHAEATWNLLDSILDFLGTDQPMVIIGVVPPYYPSVSYLDRAEHTEVVLGLKQVLNALTSERYGQSYDLEAYFTGISDLSYVSLKPEEVQTLEAAVAAQMPLYGDFYAIPFEAIARNAMPCINIGPWGKDFHKISERVFKEDLLHRTPAMVLKAIESMFNKEGDASVHSATKRIYDIS